MWPRYPDSRHAISGTGSEDAAMDLLRLEDIAEHNPLAAKDWYDLADLINATLSKHLQSEKGGE